MGKQRELYQHLAEMAFALQVGDYMVWMYVIALNAQYIIAIVKVEADGSEQE